MAKSKPTAKPIAAKPSQVEPTAKLKGGPKGPKPKPGKPRKPAA